MSTANQAIIVDITQDPGLNYLSGSAVATVQQRQANGLQTGNVIFNSVTEVRNVYIKQNNPGGNIDGEIQFKSGSGFAGDPEFKYNPNTNRLEVDGTIVVGSIYADNFFFANNQNITDAFGSSGSTTGNFIFDGDTLTAPTNGLIQIPNNGESTGIHTIDGRGRIWFGTDKSLNLVVDDTYEHVFSPDGSVAFGGGYVFPNVNGATGQVLVADSTGVMTWQDQTAAAATGNITFSGDSIGSTNNSVNVTGSNYTQIECTDNSTYSTQVWVEGSGAYTNIGSSQWSFTTPTVAGQPTNAFNFPNYVRQTTSDTVRCNVNMDTVIYTGTDQYQHTFKLLMKVEGSESAGPWDTQSCEMMVAKSFRNDTVAGSVYGLVYTSNSPLATFTTRWNTLSNRIEVLCRPTSNTYEVYVRSFVTEITTSD